MSSGIGKFVDESLERELATKRQILATLSEEVAQRELDLSTARVELETFRVRYWKLVAPLYARLDEIESEIRAYEAALDPDSEAARAEAERARDRAKESRREADLSDAVPEPEKVAVNDELKKVYRRAAKLVHPDRAVDEQDRLRRNEIMAQVNKAYESGDLEAIERLVEAYQAGHQPEAELSLRETVEVADKQIAALKQRLMEIERELMTLMESDLAKLMRDVERGEAKGRNPLKELTSQLEEKITQALERLRDVRARARSSGSAAPAESESNDHEQPTLDDQFVVEGMSDEGVSRSDHLDDVFRPEALIHTTARGEKVRSKSEVIIANLLEQLELEYFYEYPLEGIVAPGVKRPDFLVRTADGETMLWEHLGMLSNPQYRAKWEAKLDWYTKNGFVMGENLFVTRDEQDGGLDSLEVRRVAEQILVRVMG